MNNILYLFSFFISGIILYLFIIDIKKIKYKIYYQIDYYIWLKIYSILTIIIIHIIWLYDTLINNNNDYMVFAFPDILIIPYLIYILSDYKENNNLSIPSKKIDVYLNYIMILYFIIITIIMVFPNKKKAHITTNFVISIVSNLEKYINIYLKICNIIKKYILNLNFKI